MRRVPDYCKRTVRWLLLHIIEEFARHAGQADIIRESVDGATMYELLFALGGSWPPRQMVPESKVFFGQSLPSSAGNVFGPASASLEAQQRNRLVQKAKFLVSGYGEPRSEWYKGSSQVQDVGS